MKSFITVLTMKQSLFLFVLVTGLSILIISATRACTPADSLNKDSQKYLSYYENVEGEKIHWEVNFDGDEIISIYKNGEKIPDELVDDYKDKVYDQLDEMRFGGNDFTFKMPEIPMGDFKIDMDEFKEDMDKFKEGLPEPEKYFEFHNFDNEEFRKEMEELQKNLNKLNLEEFKIPFDSEKFKEEMKELEKHLKKFHHDCDEETEGNVEI